MSNPDTPQDELEARLTKELTHTLKLVPTSQRELFVFELARYIAPLIETEVSRRTERLEREYSQRYDLGYAEGNQKGRERLLDELKVLLEGSLDRDGSADHEAITNGLRDLIITRRNEIREKK